VGTSVNRGVAVANASPSCVYCHGEGARRRLGTCRCVLREVFRICLEQYRYSVENGLALNRCCVTEISRGGKILTGLPHAEYVADFELAVYRALSPARRKLFDLRFAQGRTYRDCLGDLGLRRGEFFHQTYTVMELVGTECLKGLYPLDEYFGARRVVMGQLNDSAPSTLQSHRCHRPAFMPAA